MLTKADIELKMNFLTSAQNYLVKTLVNARELAVARRDLADNPYVTTETTVENYSQMMAFAEEVQGYIRATQINIQHLSEARSNHHDDFDRITTSGAASSSQTQHDQSATHGDNQNGA